VIDTCAESAFFVASTFSMVIHVHVVDVDTPLEVSAMKRLFY